jgi:hypothetical protein
MNYCENLILISNRYNSVRKKIDSCFSYGQKENIDYLKTINVEQLISREDLMPTLKCTGYFLYTSSLLDVNKLIKTEGWNAGLLNLYGRRYIEYLIDNRERLKKRSFDGKSVIVYFMGQHLDIGSSRHIGRVENGLITSKFDCNSVFEHPVGCVPSFYGDRVLLFKSNEIIEDRMNRYILGDIYSKVKRT